MNLKNKIRGLKEIWQFENRWQLLFNRLLFPAEKISIYRYGDFEILIDHAAGDANGAREVLTTGMYRCFFESMTFPERPLKVIDLGANTGGFPLLLAAENIPVEKLLAVEINPQTFSRLCFNIERNMVCDFYPVRAALTGSNRRLKLSFGNSSTSDNIYAQPVERPSLSVCGLSFDNLFDKFFAENETVDICKMDVEGAEFEVFAGNEYQRLRNCRYLLIEIHHSKEKPRDLVRQKLFEVGFQEEDPETKTDEFHHVHLFENKILSK